MVSFGSQPQNGCTQCGCIHGHTHGQAYQCGCIHSHTQAYCNHPCDAITIMLDDGYIHDHTQLRSQPHPASGPRLRARHARGSDRSIARVQGGNCTMRIYRGFGAGIVLCVYTEGSGRDLPTRVATPRRRPRILATRSCRHAGGIRVTVRPPVPACRGGWAQVSLGDVNLTRMRLLGRQERGPSGLPLGLGVGGRLLTSHSISYTTAVIICEYYSEVGSGLGRGPL